MKHVLMLLQLHIPRKIVTHVHLPLLRCMQRMS